MTIVRLWLLGIVLVLGAAALEAASLPVPPFTPPGVVVAPEAQAWFDTPLPGTVLPRAPVSVVGHATDPGGVATLELAVDGEVVAEQPAGSGGDAREAPLLLARARLRWPEPAPGMHLLTLTGIGTDGERGYPAQIVVTILRRPPQPATTPRPTPRPTARPTPTATPKVRVTPRPTPRSTPRPTPKPTPRPCLPGAPSLVSPPDFFLVDEPSGNPPTLSWAAPRARSCQPTGYLLRVVDDDGGLVLERRLSSGARRFTPARELPNCRVYQWSVRAFGPGGLGPTSGRRSFAISYRCS